MKNVVEVCLAVQIVHLGIVFQKNLQPIVSFTVACDYRSNDNNYDFFKWQTKEVVGKISIGKLITKLIPGNLPSSSANSIQN